MKCRIQSLVSKIRFPRKLFYLKLMKTVFRNTKTILDVGCGYGEFIHICSEFGKFCVGVDISLHALVKAKQMRDYYTDYVLADMFNLPFRNRAFAAIFFSHVIEHVKLREAVLLLKDFGRIAPLLIVVTPSYHRHFWTPGHVIAYTSETLKKVLHAACYRVLLVTLDKAFVINLSPHLLPKFLIKILNLLPIPQVKLNLLAIAITDLSCSG